MSELTQKIKTRDELSRLTDNLRRSGKKIGFTSGVFDLIHPGHVAYLEEAKKQCDVLVVGINSDQSVKMYKGDNRPINSESDRIRVVAGLASVDFAFIFSERRNAENIKALKPDYYIKAGDYKKEELTSAKEIESYGGKVVIIPPLEGFSSTNLIEKISKGGYPAASAEDIEYEIMPAVFIDRDGVINENVEYLHEPEKFALIPGVLEGLKLLQQNGFRLIVVTNQAGIGLGYFTKEDFYKVNRKLLKLCAENEIQLDRIYFCPHSKADNCICRKPAPGMLLRAQKELNLDLSRSFMIGDTTADLKAGIDAGCTPILVETGHAGKDREFSLTPAYSGKDLLDAARWIISKQKDQNKQVRTKFGAKDPSRTKVLESVGQVSAQLGHDLNNLLGSIQGCVDLIKLKLGKFIQGPNPVERQLVLINSSLVKAEKITRKIRGYVRPGPIELEPIELAFCVEQALSQLKGLGVKSEGIQLALRSKSKAMLHEFYVVQMIVNICLNAIEAMKETPERLIVIHLEDLALGHSPVGNAVALPPGDYVRLSIMDHGKGLSGPAKEELFEPFFSTNPKSIGEAMGLSLAMANELMLRHKGAISLHSIEQTGTVVHLYFPKIAA